MIVHNNALSGQKATIGFTVPGAELRSTLKALEPVVADMKARVEFEDSVSKVSIVGTGMREHSGVAQRMFEALAEANITMKMITTGDIKISVLVDRKDGPTALAAVHQKFGLHEPAKGRGKDEGGRMKDEQTSPHPSSFILHPSPADELFRQLLSSMEEIVVSSATLNFEHGLVYVFNLPDHPKSCARLFRAVADAGIIVDMIVQNPSDKDRSQISFSVPVNDLQKALSVTRKEALAIDPAASVEAGPHVARLIVTGVGMRSHTGVAKKMFHALAATGINIAMINTSEVSINVVVDRAKGQEALDAIKSAFNL
jgi:aspartate kinase